jgi:hypothetical protein
MRKTVRIETYFFPQNMNFELFSVLLARFYSLFPGTFYSSPRSVRLAPLGYSPMLEPIPPTLARLLLLETDTEANVVEAAAGIAAAVGRTQVRTGKVPGAAPIDTAGAIVWPTRIDH